MNVFYKFIVFGILFVKYLSIKVENKIHFAGKLDTFIKSNFKNTLENCNPNVSNTTSDSTEVKTPITQTVTRSLDTNSSSVTTIVDTIPTLLGQIEDILEDTLHNLTSVTQQNALLNNITQAVNNSLIENSNLPTNKNNTCMSLNTSNLVNINACQIQSFIEYYRSERMKYKRKTEVCDDFNIRNCLDFCGEYDVTHCEQTVSCNPERLFRCKCGGKVSFWHYHSHGNNIGIPGKTLLNSVIFLNKRRIISNNLNLNTNCYVNKLLGEMCKNYEDKALATELNNLEILSQLEKYLFLNNNACNPLESLSNCSNQHTIYNILKKISQSGLFECINDCGKQKEISNLNNSEVNSNEANNLVDSITKLLDSSAVKNLLGPASNIVKNTTNTVNQVLGS